MIGSTPICLECKHFLDDSKPGLRCAAFPDGIPDAIIFGDHDHHKPYKDDNGIQFEKLENTKAND